MRIHVHNKHYPIPTLHFLSLTKNVPFDIYKNQKLESRRLLKKNILFILNKKKQPKIKEETHSEKILTSHKRPLQSASSVLRSISDHVMIYQLVSIAVKIVDFINTARSI